MSEVRAVDTGRCNKAERGRWVRGVTGGPKAFAPRCGLFGNTSPIAFRCEGLRGRSRDARSVKLCSPGLGPGWASFRGEVRRE